MKSLIVVLLVFCWNWFFDLTGVVVLISSLKINSVVFIITWLEIIILFVNFVESVDGSNE